MKESYYTIGDGHLIYNYKRSIYCKNYIWEYEYRHLRNKYQILKDLGIKLEDNFYAEIDGKLHTY